MTRSIVFALLALIPLAGCGSTSSDGEQPCPPEGCEQPLPEECPDVEDPTVHYISEDPDACGLTDCGPDTDCVPCADNQEYFEDECGCGCIDVGSECPNPDDPNVHYLSEDPDMCGLTDCGGGEETDCVPCGEGQEYFQNECGCGCIDVEPTCPSPEDPNVHYLSTDPAECGMTDCGAEVDCIPCEPDQEYFENECGCGCIDPS